MQTVFIILYLALLLSYLFAERSGKKLWHAGNKIALTALYTFYGIWAVFRNPDPDTLAFRFLAALLFTAAGDILLIRFLIGGGTAFGIGNVCFAVYELLLLPSSGKTLYGRKAVLLLILLTLLIWVILCRFLYHRKWSGKFLRKQGVSTDTTQRCLLSDTPQRRFLIGPQRNFSQRKIPSASRSSSSAPLPESNGVKSAGPSRTAAGGSLLLPLSAGYLVCSTLQGVAGLFLLIAFPAASPNAILGLGSVGFWISDILLLAYRIRFPKALMVLNLNSIFYFGGMLLIVLSRGM